MKDHEIAAALVKHLYDLSQDSSVSGFADLAGFCLSIGAFDQQITRVINRLERSGDLDNVIYHSDGAHGLLSAETVEKMERGMPAEQAIVASHAYSIENTHTYNDNRISVGDGNHSLQFASGSRDVRQQIGSSRDEVLDRLIVGLKDAIKATTEMDESSRKDALADAETIETQAGKAKPRWTIIKDALDGLKGWSSLGPIVEKIYDHAASFLSDATGPIV
jgi:hypothetical protein